MAYNAQSHSEARKRMHTQNGPCVFRFFESGPGDSSRNLDNFHLPVASAMKHKRIT